MARRNPKPEDVFRAVAALALLLWAGWTFVPGTRGYIVGFGVLAFAAAAMFFATRFRKATQPEPNTMGRPLETAQSARQETEAPQPLAMPLTADSALVALRRLDWFQFEKAVAAIYRAYGDSVERLGGAHPDGGVDLIVTAKTGRFVVQCKHWCNWTVGVKNIRELLGTLTTSGIPKGVFVTMRGYSDEARDLGVKHGLVLLDEKQLAELVVSLGPTHGAEVLALLNDPRKFCPKCEREMVLRTAKRGAKAGRQFWGCPDYPRCDATLEAEAV